MMEFLDSNALLSQSQFGFRQGSSTLSQLFLSKSRLVECINDRACVDCEFSDLSKAFDSISHKKFLIKLRAYGIHNSVCNWIEDFLTHKGCNVSLLITVHLAGCIVLVVLPKEVYLGLFYS